MGIAILLLLLAAATCVVGLAVKGLAWLFVVAALLALAAGLWALHVDRPR